MVLLLVFALGFIALGVLAMTRNSVAAGVTFVTVALLAISAGASALLT